jgi:hypothetical protein
MISNLVIFIFGVVIFGAWIVGSFLEFKKMDDNPKDYEEKRNIDHVVEKILDKKE